MTRCVVMGVILVLLAGPGAFGSLNPGVDHTVLEDLRARAEPYAGLSEVNYRASVGRKKHALRALRQEFQQFVASSEIEVPTPAEALAWREALRSSIIQQFALEWMAVTWARAELALRAHPPKTDPELARTQAELNSTREAIHQVVRAITGGKAVPAETQHLLQTGWKAPPQPLTPVCAPLIQAVRLLGHLAPETLQETLGIEHEKAELAVLYLREGTRNGRVPCGMELNEYATGAVRLIWGRRDPSKANVSAFTLMVEVQGSWKNSYGDTDIHWGIMNSARGERAVSFKDVQEEWAARWGLKFKRVVADGITVR